MARIWAVVNFIDPAGRCLRVSPRLSSVIYLCARIQAPEEAMAFEWDELWLNKNQQAMRALDSEQAELASELFDNKAWKAAANYRKGDFATVEELLNEQEGYA